MEKAHFLSKLNTFVYGPAFPERLICLEWKGYEAIAAEIDAAGKIYALSRIDIPPKGSGVEAIDQMFATGGFGDYPIFIVYSVPGIVFKTSTVPSTVDTEIETTVRFNVLKDVGIAKDNLIFDFFAKSRFSNESEVYIGAADRSEVNQMLDAVKGVGEEGEQRIVKGLIPGIMSLLNPVESLPGGVQAILNISYKTTSILIFKDNQLLFHREIVFGIDGSVELLAKKLYQENSVKDYLSKSKKLVKAAGLSPITRLDSEKVKVAGKLIKISEQEQTALEDARESGMARLIQNIRLSIGYFKTQTKVESVDCIYILGEGAEIPGMDKRMSDEFNTPVKIVDPFDGYALAQEEHTLQARLERDKLLYSSVMGGVRHLMKNGYESMNMLVPRGQRRQGIVSKIKKDPLLGFGPVAILLIILIILSSMYSRVSVMTSKSQSSSLNKSVATLKPLQKEMKELRSKINYAENQIAYLTSLHSGQKWSEVLLQMNRSVPEGVGIDQFRYGHLPNPEEIEITGTTLSTQKVTETARNLQESGVFKDLKIISADQEQEQVRFQMRGMVVTQ